MSGYVNRGQRMSEVELGGRYFDAEDFFPGRMETLKIEEEWRSENLDDEKEIEPIGLEDLFEERL